MEVFTKTGKSMVFHVKTLALANLAVQVLLLLAVFAAVYLAKKRQLTRHCTLMRILIPVQIMAVAAVMFPSLLSYFENVGANVEMLVHHTIGVLVIALWIYVNLAFGQVIRMPRNFRAVMRLAFVLWMIAFVLGVRMYVSFYM